MLFKKSALSLASVPKDAIYLQQRQRLFPSRVFIFNSRIEGIIERSATLCPERAY
ncbi:Uncharacterised protein [Salmonella enterica subsp. enterica]|uniref:Uncharacterized protein n=1 Tax=Salmonella enterica I TaxID=59201 RepID=A0A447N452_SALET|nr:Uncharacterised protein [Salmonella enterica subsp. enterica]